MLRRILHGCYRIQRKSADLRVTNLPAASIMPNSRGLMTDVQRLRLQQKLKQTDKFSDEQLKSGLYLIFIRKEGQVLISRNKGQLAAANFEDLKSLFDELESKAVFVDVDKDSDRCRFAIEIPSISPEDLSKWEEKFSGKFVHLRQSLFLLKSEQSALVSQSRALFTWRRRRNFCPECGSATKPKAGFSHKVCPSCDTPQYPYTAPVGIALVENQEHSQVLLVRQPRHPPGMFSCLAGFVDAGESLEQNVGREVAEEVGLTTSKVEYIASQYWPYPAGRLMLGCIATVLPGTVDIDKEELEDASWFSPAQLHKAVTRAASFKPPPEGEIWLPPPGAIAHDLIKVWLSRHYTSSSKL
ncbi:NAD(P)H pyrophosphatase NUDT13, mitochondrial-like [Neocloeon triangulifer]|uniref:NAD(P)H pyrophosphatase NUDT13, mitochondrial-like n=1 Tax=Neocloeon triangulifer TaxID=2078957 RepID=UPI00286FA0F2|nr:NAD(P)H pyrophosphatase NUDT13, mitochondrial-like [Neocloeon triangulifer]